MAGLRDLEILLMLVVVAVAPLGAAVEMEEEQEVTVRPYSTHQEMVQVLAHIHPPHPQPTNQPCIPSC